jgi:hypothetical protein
MFTIVLATFPEIGHFAPRPASPGCSSAQACVPEHQMMIPARTAAARFMFMGILHMADLPVRANRRPGR